MSYVVSARKYRPQRFEDVVGQQHITSTITNAILNDKLAHAFLFCGPRGVGKTTCARLLAKVINMEDPKAAIKDGSYADTDIDVSMNIVELDGASNNSVEDIRRLNEEVRRLPMVGTHKIFILDEVHMLSTAAFNAFLKTLEEPPPHVKFVLATTEKHKIIPTILSRCQLYDFRRIQVKDIIEQLERVAKSEGITTDYDALRIIAEKADGAMRDALSLFDRVTSSSSGSVTFADVSEVLNVLDYDYYFKAIDCMLREDAASLLLLHEEVLARGFEGDALINGLAGHLRYLLYCKEEPTQKMLQMSESLKERYMEQSKSIAYGTILTSLNLANQCDITYLRSKDKRLHVEIALLKICFAQRQTYPSRGAAPSQEKKSPEVSELARQAAATPAPPPVKETPITPSVSSQEQRVVIDPIPAVIVSTPVEPTPAASKIETIATVTPVPTQIAPKQSISTTLLNTPKLSSVDDLLAAAASDLACTDNKAREIKLSEAEELWTQYSNEKESPTLKSVLTNTLLKVQDGQLQAVVPTNIAREEIQQEADLYARLRTHFNQNDLTIEIVVDRDQFPDMMDTDSVKAVTPRQRYDHLKAINPLVDDLIAGLNLKLDQ